MALNFPDPIEINPWIDPNGMQWQHDGDGWKNVGNAVSQFLLAAHPIGCVYQSIDPTLPDTLFGGIWEGIGAGRALVGYHGSDPDFNESEKLGGSKTHQLSSNQMPTHSHTQNSHSHSQVAHSHAHNAHSHTTSSGYNFLAITAGKNVKVNTASREKPPTSTSDEWGYVYMDSEEAADALIQEPAGTANATTTEGSRTPVINTATAINQNTGNNEPHSSVQPYTVVYMWKRTA